MGWDLHQRVLRHRATPYSHLTRYDWQLYLEELLFALFDATVKERPPQQRTVTDLLSHIERFPTRMLTLTQAAEYLNISPSHLSRQFKAQTGTRFIDYVTGKRLERAKLLLLHTDLPVLKIAGTLGFQPLNYFSRAFKGYTGLTPSNYRRQTVPAQEIA